MNLLRFSVLPKSVDFGLLILRLHLGICMLYLHGWDKLMKFSSAAPSFPSPIALLPPQAAYGLMVFAEAGCSMLLIVGLLTRFASLTLIINMSVAFFIAMKGNPHTPGGELALMYLGGYVVLFLTGAGRFSADRQ